MLFSWQKKCYQLLNYCYLQLCKFSYQRLERSQDRRSTDVLQRGWHTYDHRCRTLHIHLHLEQCFKTNNIVFYSTSWRHMACCPYNYDITVELNSMCKFFVTIKNVNCVKKLIFWNYDEQNKHLIKF